MDKYLLAGIIWYLGQVFYDAVSHDPEDQFQNLVLKRGVIDIVPAISLRKQENTHPLKSFTRLHLYDQVCLDGPFGEVPHLVLADGFGGLQVAHKVGTKFVHPLLGRL